MLVSLSHWGLHELPETPEMILFAREEEYRRNLAEAHRTGNDKYLHWIVSVDGGEYLDADFSSIEEAEEFIKEKIYTANLDLEGPEKYRGWDCEFIRYWMDDDAGERRIVKSVEMEVEI